ncbi:MAG TPA: hypothetical protein VFB73_07970 [Chloroflexota bacterium]|nr:hypothetical protein [Chloroflexota bacterium]
MSWGWRREAARHENEFHSERSETGEAVLRRALRRWGRTWRAAPAGRRAAAHRTKRHPFRRGVTLGGLRSWLRLRPAQVQAVLELLVTGAVVVWEQLRSRWGLR